MSGLPNLRGVDKPVERHDQVIHDPLALLRVLPKDALFPEVEAALSWFVERVGEVSPSRLAALRKLAIAELKRVTELPGAATLVDAALGGAPPVGVLMRDVRRETVSWLWRNRIPFGKVTLLDGDPGQGKTTLALAIAAALTRGYKLPGNDAPLEPAGVVVVILEDGLGDTIRPRLEAVGADLTKVWALTEVPTDEGPRPITLPDDICVLERAVEFMGAKLVIIDPLMGVLSGKLDSYRDQDVRRALTPLARFAERTEVAVLLNRHFTKLPGGNPLYRGSGSIGIIAAARSGLLIAPDPDDPSLRVLASTKSNLGPPPPSLRFSLELSPSVADTVVLTWAGESTHSAAELLAAKDGSDPRKERPKAFLRKLLVNGPMGAREAEEQAEAEGYSRNVIRMAMRALGIVPYKDGFQGRWMWELPGKPKDSQGGRI